MGLDHFSNLFEKLMDITKQSLSANILYIILLSSIFWSGWLLLPEFNQQIEAINFSAQSSLGNYVDAKFIENPLLGIVLSSILVVINSLLILRLCIKNVIFLDRNYMPALVYVIISAGYFNSYLSFRPLIVAMLMLVAFNSVFRGYNVKSLISGVYLKIGTLFGVAAVIYEPAIFLFPLLIAALMMFRLFDLREWSAAIVGFAIPIFFAAYVGWLMGNGFVSYFENYIQVVSSPNAMALDFRRLKITDWAFISVIVLLVILSVIMFSRYKQRLSNKVKPYKAYMFFVFTFIVSAVMLLVVPCRSLYFMPIVALPLAVIIPAYFMSSKANFFSNFLYLMLIGTSITIYLAPLLKLF